MSDNIEKPDVTTETVPSEDKKQAKAKQPKQKERKDSFKIGVWLKEIKAEMGKIVWPNRKELAKMTFTVIVTSLIFGVLIAGLDAVFSFATGFLVDLF